MKQEDSPALGPQGLQTTDHLNMGGSPPTREESIWINKLYPLKTDRYDQHDDIWFPLPPINMDLLEYLEALAIEAGYKDLRASLAEIRIPNRRMWGLRNPQRGEDTKKPTPVRQLRNALLLAKTGTLLYDPNIPPVFTRRRLERNITLIFIRMETFYELD